MYSNCMRGPPCPTLLLPAWPLADVDFGTIRIRPLSRRVRSFSTGRSIAATPVYLGRDGAAANRSGRGLAVRIRQFVFEQVEQILDVPQCVDRGFSSGKQQIGIQEIV